MTYRQSCAFIAYMDVASGSHGNMQDPLRPSRNRRIACAAYADDLDAPRADRRLRGLQPAQGRQGGLALLGGPCAGAKVPGLGERDQAVSPD